MSASSARRAAPLGRTSATTPRLLPIALAAACAAAGFASAARAQALAPEAAASAPAAAASAPASGAEVTLPAVRVKATRELSATTEGSGSYAPAAVTLGKGQRSVREVPHSVTVVTRQQLTEQNLTTVESALKNVTGVTIQRYDATGNYTQFIARGFAADSYLLDGLTVQTDTNGIYLDLYAFDRVEVQRGAASLFSGGGEPGITVNMVRKRAQPQFKGEGALMLGSWDDRRVQADVTSALNTAGTLRGRVAAVAQDFDTFMDGIDDNSKRMVYGTLEADLTDHTTVSTGFTWQKVKTVLSRGLPTWPGGRLIEMRRETMPVVSWNRQQLDAKTAFVELEHRAADDGLLKLSYRHVKRGNQAAYLDPSAPDPTPGPTYGDMTALSGSAFDREDTDDAFDAYYSHPFTLAGRRHNLLVGADYRRSRNDSRYADYVPIAGTLNLFRHDPFAIPEPDFDLDAIVSHVVVKSYGAYGQLRLKPTDHWTLIGGGRVSTWRSAGVSYTTPMNFAAKNEFTPYAAAIYDLTRSVSLYGSFNEIFKPQNALDQNYQQIAPRTGRAFEVGAKGEAFDGRLAWSTAVYRLTERNRAVGVTVTPPTQPYSVPIGKARAQGFEIDARGEITRGWSLSGGYAYTDTRVLSNTAVSAPLNSFTSRHSGNLWSRHQLGEAAGPLQGVVVAGGLRSVSKFYNGSGANRVNAPGYTVYNAHASYPINGQFDISLNVDNLFDKVYWEKVSGPSRQNFWGEPRRITVALKGTF